MIKFDVKSHWEQFISHKHLKSSESKVGLVSSSLISALSLYSSSVTFCWSICFVACVYMLSRSIRKLNVKDMQYSGFLTSEMVAILISGVTTIVSFIVFGLPSKDAVMILAVNAAVYSIGRAIVHFTNFRHDVKVTNHFF